MTPGLHSHEINGLVGVIGNLEEPSSLKLRLRPPSSNRLQSDISEEEKVQNYHNTHVN